MSLSVVIVEKDALTRMTLVYKFDALQCSVSSFENYESAAKAFESADFDVMLMSLGLGDPDGTVLAAKFKELQPHLKVIALEGRFTPKVQRPYVDAYIRKPFSLGHVDAALKQILAQQGSIEPA